MKGRNYRINREILHHRRKAQRGYEALVAAGELKPMSEWSLEELARGRPRNRIGGFTGRIPVWMTQAVQEEIARRYKQAAISELSKHFPKALKVLVGLLDEEDPGIRLKACQLLIEYTVGKPKVELTTDSQAASMLAAALVMPNGLPAHPTNGKTIEGEWSND
jgi:hypothetical protein